ncbi:sodium/proton antiporter (CPA1 family) [Natranaerovirga hydrolytica]|uniref:Sodium/proton antiporter (CPA1 family) n=1 Tax=Natranaerovirga hydrolytica TaxID=680378 RepID=A0A4R1MYR1_9FIRM|nr:cation:proton antiporter [Natranaerovirga hydrolytica]TCK98448.1 sodium/proton antiporter (CPA1 family) [Natranaerovirga hydrolytica]
MDLVTSLGLVTVLGLIANYLFVKMKLPGLLGMLLLGIAIGPYGMDWLSEEMLMVSADFRKIALIIILLRAGLGIKKEDLNKVGQQAIKLSFIPCLAEGFSIALLSMYLLDFTFVEGGILGFIIAAVSPAVIVPQMLKYIDLGVGKKKGIPTLVLASASVDDIFAITLFSSFMGIYGGSQFNITTVILGIPLSIVLGIVLGIIVGSFFVFMFNKYHIRDTKKILLMLGFAILLTSLETVLEDTIQVAGLLGVMTIGFILLERKPKVAERLSIKFNKIWIFAEILLFVLVGAQVNIYVAFDAGFIGLGLLFLGLIARSIGVMVSTIGSKYDIKEKAFLVIAFMPKATVQAAIGALPMEAGLPSGELILAIAVLSIIITAPLGAIGISRGKKWL